MRFTENFRFYPKYGLIKKSQTLLKGADLKLKKIMIYGYSERGIFNSIVYYLDSKPMLIGSFLKELGVDGFTEGKYDFEFLIEQSFSDFGDSDLTIIATDCKSKKKTVLFIEGKVKTYSKNAFSLEDAYDIIKDVLKKNEKPKEFSSNLFVQLYYKYLLKKEINKDALNPEEFNYVDVFKKKNRAGEFVNRKIGENDVVNKACEKTKGAEEYYYIAIIPRQETGKTLSEYFGLLELMPKENYYILCAYWEDIEAFFISINAKKVIENFDFNKGQIF